MPDSLTHYLYPSTLFASLQPTVVSTVLGSCIAICLYDPLSGIGGVNHFMLPLWNGEGLASPKYGDIALEKLLHKMLLLGASRNSLQAKVFGGADSRQATNVFRIGERNSECAFKLLSYAGIPVISSHVGGELPRKILFYTATGEALLKVLTKSSLATKAP